MGGKAKEELNMSDETLEEWMESYSAEPLDEQVVVNQTRCIISWWQQADKPWRGHDAKKNANEIALEAIEKLLETHWRVKSGQEN